MSNQPLITLKSIDKTFYDAGTKVEVIKGLDFELKEQEFVSIRGASGAGKSTLLHIMGLLDKPTKGKVYFEGKDVTAFSDNSFSTIRNEKIGFVFQFHHLLPDFSALENLLIPKMIGKRVSQKDKNLALDLLKTVGLEHRVNHLPSQLSGGERQRVAIARALIQNPKCILADEPSGNLDQENTEALHQLIVKLHQEMGIAVVLVTHDLQLFKIAPKQCLMENGNIKADN